MEPIEPGSNPPQDPETGTTPESQWPGLWDDLANVKALADMAMGHPQTSRLAMALAGLCQVTENLAQRVEALESPKPCEGCGDDEQLGIIKAELAMAEPEERPGIFRQWLEKWGGA